MSAQLSHTLSLNASGEFGDGVRLEEKDEDRPIGRKRETVDASSLSVSIDSTRGFLKDRSRTPSGGGPRRYDLSARGDRATGHSRSVTPRSRSFNAWASSSGQVTSAGETTSPSGHSLQYCGRNTGGSADSSWSSISTPRSKTSYRHSAIERGSGGRTPVTDRPDRPSPREVTSVKVRAAQDRLVFSSTQSSAVKVVRSLDRDTVTPPPVVIVDTSKARSNADVVRHCIKELGWKDNPVGRTTGGEPSDIYWHGIHFAETVGLNSGKVNKFPGMIEIVRKVNLGRALDVMHCLYPDEYSFHPRSWFLPQQYFEFCEAVRKMKEKPVFIVKPDEGSQGEGIYLIEEPRDYVLGHRRHIVQDYIANPLLVDHLKFDLRIYVVVTSLEPLEIYISKDGLARFCTKPYQHPTIKNIHESFMHLTNYSLNKHSQNYIHTESDDDGSKRTIGSVFRLLKRKDYDTESIWNDIKQVVIKTMIAITPELKVEQHAVNPTGRSTVSCFQILGFDVLLTDTGQSVLLEVNASPSLRMDYDESVSPGVSECKNSPVDEEIKKHLVMDTLLLVAPRFKAASSSHRQQGSEMLKRCSSDIGLSLKGGSSERDKLYYLGPGDSELQLLPKPPHRGYGSLELIYPRKYATDYESMRLLDRTANVFLDCPGVRESLRLSPAAFRVLIRKCHLSGGQRSTCTNASLDVLYIEMVQRWKYTNPSKVTGLCFQGFVEAFFGIARQRWSMPLVQSVERLLNDCEVWLREDKRKSATLPRFPRKVSTLSTDVITPRDDVIQPSASAGNWVTGRTGRKKRLEMTYRVTSPNPVITRRTLSEFNLNAWSAD